MAKARERPQARGAGSGPARAALLATAFAATLAAFIPASGPALASAPTPASEPTLPSAPTLATGSGTAPGEVAAVTSATAVQVSFRGEQLLEVRGPLGTLSPAARAAAIERRLAAAAALPDSTLDAVRIQRRPGSFDVYAGPQFVMSVTPVDAAGLGRTAEQRAADVAVLVREALRREYEERSVAGLLRAGTLSVAALGAAVVVWLALGAGFRKLERLWRRERRETGGDAAVTAGRVLSHQLAELLVGLTRLVRLALGFVIIVLAGGYVLSLYPWTRALATTLDVEIRNAFDLVGGSIVEYLPNLVYVAIIVVLFRVLIRTARLFFDRIAEGQLRVEGFHAEWGPPTFQIVRVMLIAFAVAVVFPYLPASDSRAFQGVTVLLGVVLSFGSATAVANLIGGLVITYMRALRVGDRVRIGEAEGDVVGRDAFVVRVRTIKNVEVTIPNAAVLSGAVVNYSAGTRDRGLALHTTVTIGYDAPWRRIHELLVAAARRTAGVEREPAPFVLQTALGDFAVSYQVNAWTRDASRASAILSELHAHIQDEFAIAGIEIMSPVYEAQRDGGSTLPPLPPELAARARATPDAPDPRPPARPAAVAT